jgi:hypothetical protein
MTTSLRETTEATMIAAHKAGVAYWRNTRAHDATRASLESHARSCGWHGEDNVAWLAGFYGAMRREAKAMIAAAIDDTTVQS